MSEWGREDKLRRPAVMEVEGEADPGAAPPPPEPDLPEGRAMAGLGRLARRRPSFFAGLRPGSSARCFRWC